MDHEHVSIEQGGVVENHKSNERVSNLLMKLRDYSRILLVHTLIVARVTWLHAVSVGRWTRRFISASYAARSELYSGTDVMENTSYGTRVIFGKPIAKWMRQHAMELAFAVFVVVMMCMLLWLWSALYRIKQEAIALSIDHYEAAGVTVNHKRIHFTYRTIDLVEFDTIDDALRHGMRDRCSEVDVKLGAFDIVPIDIADHHESHYTIVNDILEVHIDVLTRAHTKARIIMPKLWNITDIHGLNRAQQFNPCIITVKLLNGTLLHMSNPQFVDEISDVEIRSTDGHNVANVAESYSIYPFMNDVGEFPKIVSERRRTVHVRYRNPDGLLRLIELNGGDAYLVQMAMDVSFDGLISRIETQSNEVAFVSMVE